MLKVSEIEKNKLQKYPQVLLRIGIGGTFIWVGINILLFKNYWHKFVPFFVNNIISPANFLPIFSAFILLVGIFLISGILTNLFSLIAFFTIAIITAVEGINELTFTNFGLIFSSLALFYLSLLNSNSRTS